MKQENPDINGLTGSEYNLMNATDPNSNRIYVSPTAPYVDPDPGFFLFYFILFYNFYFVQFFCILLLNQSTQMLKIGHSVPMVAEQFFGTYDCRPEQSCFVVKIYYYYYHNLMCLNNILFF